MPSTEIILTENIPGLGAEADVVKVRRGYARNYLLPQGKAYEVTPASLRELDNLKKKRAEREARELNDAEELTRRIGKLRVTFTLETGETRQGIWFDHGAGYCNADQARDRQEIDRHKVVLERPIKDTGEHEVAIKLHHDVTAQFNFDVKSAEATPRPRSRETAGEHPRRSTVHFSEERKKQNKWRLNRPPGQVRSLVKQSGNAPGRGWPERNGGKVFPNSPTGSAQDIHRAPPHRVEAEQGVLGSMLISPRETIAECVEKINDEYFYVPAHQTIYTVLVDLWNAGQAIDLITFTQVLRDRNLLDSVGGAVFCHQSVHLRADGRERGLLPRDCSRQIHPAPNHRDFHGERAARLRRAG